jgi:putative ABC transport system permease protein
VIGTLVAAWFDVRTRPLRTLASVAGMVAAITAVITVDAAGALSRRSQADYLERQFGRAATVELRTEARGTEAGRETARVVPGFLGHIGVTLVTPTTATGLLLLDRDQRMPVQALLVAPAYAAVRAVDVVAGRFPTRQFLAPHAVVSERVARALGYEPAAFVGRPLRVVVAGSDADPDPRTAPTVTVVVDAVMRTQERSGDPVDVLMTGGQAPAEPDAWLLRVAPADVPLLRGTLDTLSRDHPRVAAALQVRRVDQDDVLAPLLRQQAATGRVIALVALAVGGLGLFGVGLAGVRERSHEFGIRRALGATRSAIFGSVLFETVLEVLVSAAVAVVLADVIVHLVPRQLVVALLPVPDHVALPVGSAVRGVVSAAAVGLGAGLIPAIRAVRVSVRAAIAG